MSYKNLKHRVGEYFKLEVDGIQAIGEVEKGTHKLYVKYFIGGVLVVKDVNLRHYLDKLEHSLGKIKFYEQSIPLLITEDGCKHIGVSLKEVLEEVKKICEEHGYKKHY